MIGSAINGREKIEFAVRLAERLGIPLLILAFFMGQDAGWIPSKSRAALEAIVAHAGKVDEVVRSRSATDVALIEVLRRKARIDQALCRALAREPEVLRVCLEP